MNNRQRSLAELPIDLKALDRQEEPIDLDALEREVLAQGPEAALPQNLSDWWLRILVRRLLQGKYDDEWAKFYGICAGPGLLVTAIMNAQSSSHPKSPEPRFADCFLRYRTALIEELLGRQTGVFRREYSLTNIFA